jgi:RNA binding exosome subunit
MKNNIDITSSVSLDEISEQLVNNLSTKELVNFVLQIGDRMSDSDEYYFHLEKLTRKINKANEAV